jgi:putative transcriptional regulator
MASLAPSLLISMPQLADPNFNRSVVLLIRHKTDEGAFGLIVNRPLVTTGRVVVDTATERHTTDERELHLWVGGPVEPQSSWMLVGQPDEVDEDVRRAMRISDGVYMSRSSELLRRLLEPEPPPRARLVMGYSGWGVGQLEAELEASAWLLSDVDPDLIFNTPPERIWEAAIRRLGADPATLQMSRGVH